MENKNIEAIKKANEYLERLTPFTYDCGKICNGKCCKGNDTDGMLLFPGEEKLFSEVEGFTVYFEERYNAYAVRCSGFCDRNARPLSCRIFPYFLYVKDENSKPTVLPDIRAMDFCPVLENEKEVDKRFLRALRIAAARLISDKEIKDFLIDITARITDFNSL